VRALLGLQRGVVALSDETDRLSAVVVAGTLILDAGIAEPDRDEIGRRLVAVPGCGRLLLLGRARSRSAEPWELQGRSALVASG
jgi:hypothetical protein